MVIIQNEKRIHKINKRRVHNETCKKDQTHIEKTEEVLGVSSLEGMELRDYLTGIICHKEQKLTFAMTNGDQITVAWSVPSRQNSWTEEMKQAARQKTLERSSL